MKQSRFSRRNFFRRSLAISLVPSVSSAGIAGALVPQESDRSSIASMLESKSPRIWLFTGDSITLGAKHTHGYRSYSEIFAERIRWELRRARDIILNTGISGNTTQNILDDYEWRVEQFRPNVVSLMIGTNDCVTGRLPIEKFDENLGVLIGKFRDLGAIPVLHTPNIIITDKDPSRARLGEYVDVIRKQAVSEKVILVDHYKYWMEMHRNGPVKVFREWLNDPVHPGGEGHAEIARLMFRELGIFDPNASTCGGPHYEGDHDQ